MRVLHVNAGNLYGGIEVLLATLVRSTAAFGRDAVDFAVFFDGRSAAELRKLGAAVHVLGPVQLRNPLQIWRARRNLRRLLERERYDVVISHGAWNQVLAGPVAREAAIPSVVWMHDPPEERPNAIERWASRIRPDLAICNSRYTLKRLPRIYSGVPAEILYCPVDTPQPADPAASRIAWRSRNGASPQEVVIVQIARLEPYKGHRIHLEALGKLRAVPGWRCFFVAHPQKPQEETLLAELREMASRFEIAGRVHFLGWQPGIEAILAGADIYCQPNGRPEPFGIVYVEALAAGLACIASELGGPVEIFEGGYGKLVRPNDAEGLMRTLRELIEQPGERDRLRTMGPGRAREISDPARQVAALDAMLHTVAARARAAGRKVS